MRNSCRDGSLEVWLRRMCESLDEETLRRVIDDPLEDAASGFQRDATGCISHRQLLDVTGRFVAHLYRNALPMPVHMTEEQARAEALYILESGYPSESGERFDDAYSHAIDPLFDGVAQVLDTVKEIVRARLRRDYDEGVLETELVPLDWSRKRQITTLAMRELWNYLPDNLRGQSITSMTEILEDLLKVASKVRGLSPLGVTGTPNEYETVRVSQPQTPQ
jgi:hypothetical protein